MLKQDINELTPGTRYRVKNRNVDLSGKGVGHTDSPFVQRIFVGTEERMLDGGGNGIPCALFTSRITKNLTVKMNDDGKSWVYSVAKQRDIPSRIVSIPHYDLVDVQPMENAT